MVGGSTGSHRRAPLPRDSGSHTDSCSARRRVEMTHPPSDELDPILDRSSVSELQLPKISTSSVIEKNKNTLILIIEYQ